MKKLFFLSFFCISTFSCEHTILDSSKKIPKESLCKTDSDCKLATKDCCDCNHGGERISLLKTNKQTNKDCNQTICASFISNHPSCQNTARAYCKEGTCQIRLY